MIVKIEYSGKKNDPCDEYGYGGWCRVSVDGKVIANGYDFSECPEDANLGRGLNFIYDLPEILREAYQEGAFDNGFIIEEIENAEQ
jgi:hypothetical protein